MPALRVAGTLILSLVTFGKSQDVGKAYCSLVSHGVAAAELCSNEGTVRLVNGTTVSAGRVEICLNRHWSTACGGYGWGSPEAHVTCRELGYDCM